MELRQLKFIIKVLTKGVVVQASDPSTGKTELEAAMS